jgi:hypothetical protein
MFEAIIAALILVSLILAAVVPAGALLWLGVIVGSLGALVGLPAGVVYHIKLWRSLQAAAQATDGFWLRPHRLHDRLADAQLRPIEAWFAIGVVGFVLTVLGGAAVVTAFVRLLAG